MILARRTFLLGMAVMAGGCRTPDAESPVPDRAEVQKFLAALGAEKTSGPYAVSLSRAILEGTDVWIWGPTTATSRAPDGFVPPASYFDRLSGRFGPAAAQSLVEAPGQAIVDAPLVQGDFPLVLFQPGATFGARDYRIMIEDISSQGAVVLALNPLASPRGAEPRFAEVADEFRKLLDATPRLISLGMLPAGSTDHIILAGHSIGGAGAVLALDHPLAKAAVNVDGDYAGQAARPAPNKPILYILGENPREPASSEVRRARVWSEVRKDVVDAAAVRLRGMAHLDSTDAGVLSGMLMAASAPSVAPVRNGAVGNSAVRACIRQWMAQRPTGDSWLPTLSGDLVGPGFA